MHRAAAVLLVLLATPALAFRARPVSDLRFDGRSFVMPYAAASDGRDFVVLMSTGSLRPIIYTQRIVDGRAAGPLRGVGTGYTSPGGLFWTGSHYLAAWGGPWQKGEGLFVGRVSRDGSPLLTPSEPVVPGINGLLCVNGRSAMAFTYEFTLTAQPLDLDGNPVGRPVTHEAKSGQGIAAGPAGDGFVVVFYGSGGASALLLRADGTALTTIPVTTSSTTRAVVAASGEDTLVVWGENAGLKSAIVGQNGVPHVRTVHAGLGNPMAAVWDGTRFVVGVIAASDAALVTIDRHGDSDGRLAWLLQGVGLELPTAVATNGQELLATVFDGDSFATPIDPATLVPRTPLHLGRTLASQGGLAVQAGRDGYLATWYEEADGARTLRASRIDAAGNYLDGEGIEIATRPPSEVPPPAPAVIEGNGPEWLVLWKEASVIYARAVSRAPFRIGFGYSAAAAWNGSHYVILRETATGIDRDLALGSGSFATRPLIRREFVDEPGGRRITDYGSPALLRLGNELVALFRRTRWWCRDDGTCESLGRAVMGLRLDRANAEPFVIADDVQGPFAAAAGTSSALVVWQQGKYQFIRGAFLSTTSAGASFPIDTYSTAPAVAFDGRDFVVTSWTYASPSPKITVSHVSPGGAVRTELLRMEREEFARGPVVAASATLPALLGFVHEHPAHDGVQRAAVVFASETGDVSPPRTPSIVSATRHDDDTVSVTWTPVSDALGVSIELHLPDGTLRPIGVAAGAASSARVPLAGIEGIAVRLRAWNAGGLSEPSRPAVIVSGSKRRPARP